MSEKLIGAANETTTVANIELCVVRLQSEVNAYLRACMRRESLLTEEDLKDVSAEVVATIWSRKNDLDHPLRYARKVVRHRLIQFLREKRRRLEVLSEWHNSRTESISLGSEPSLGQSLGTAVRPRQEFVRACLERQDGQTRLILHLRYEAGFSWRLIAEVVGGSAASVRMKEQRFCRRILAAWKTERLV